MPPAIPRPGGRPRTPLRASLATPAHTTPILYDTLLSRYTDSIRLLDPAAVEPANL